MDEQQWTENSLTEIWNERQDLIRLAQYNIQSYNSLTKLLVPQNQGLSRPADRLLLLFFFFFFLFLLLFLFLFFFLLFSLFLFLFLLFLFFFFFFFYLDGLGLLASAHSELINFKIWILQTVGRTRWATEQPVAKPLPIQDKATQTGRHALSGIRTHDPSVWAGEHISCLRRGGNCNRPHQFLTV
jgi:hypothetical protein